MTIPVFKTTLENGLTVILKEMHHAPVASFWVWYRVGSRNEPTGRTGASHWVEHMMFKGTEKFPPGALDRFLSREGGRFNAFTWLDFTAYYATLPSQRIDLALDLEADRLTQLRMAPEDVESERTVILSELHMYENQPDFLMGVETSAAAFRVHPYHHETIGDEVDLQTMTRDDLYDHYRRYYQPNNAVVVVAGHFERDEMLRAVEARFGQIPAGAPPPPVTRQEPPQRGERRVTVHGPGDTAYLTYNYRAPAATDDDFFPLSSLNAAFTGGSGLGLFGGTTTNKSSRLYRALVSGELAAGIFGSMAPTIDPYLFTVGAVVRAGQEVDAVEEALQAEIARLESEPITEEELRKALKRARVEFAAASESVSGQGQMLGYAEIVAGDYRWAEQALDRISSVTLDDVARVRAAYLQPKNCTVARYIPHGNGPG